MNTPILSMWFEAREAVLPLSPLFQTVVLTVFVLSKELALSCALLGVSPFPHSSAICHQDLCIRDKYSGAQ